MLRDDFKVNPEDTMVAVGDTAILKCQPPRGEPEPRVIWRKDGSRLTTNSRITLEQDGDLMISSIEKVDAGEYTCVAVNKAGESESQTAKVTVYGKYPETRFRLLLCTTLLAGVTPPPFRVSYQLDH